MPSNPLSACVLLAAVLALGPAHAGAEGRSARDTRAPSFSGLTQKSAALLSRSLGLDPVLRPGDTALIVEDSLTPEELAAKGRDRAEAAFVFVSVREPDRAAGTRRILEVFGLDPEKDGAPAAAESALALVDSAKGREASCLLRLSTEDGGKEVLVMRGLLAREQGDPVHEGFADATPLDLRLPRPAGDLALARLTAASTAGDGFRWYFYCTDRACRRGATCGKVITLLLPTGTCKYYKEFSWEGWSRSKKGGLNTKITKCGCKF